MQTAQLFREAKNYLAGGVNSPVRSFRAVGGEPIFIESGKGSKIYSVEGKEFIDYCQGFGALILGHAHPEIKEKLSKALIRGSCFGAPTQGETELAGVICGAIPSIEKIRFTNSGTEAVMGAIRLARAYTKRSKLIKFSGSYHGHADYLLDCPGIPREFKKNTLVAPYNDTKKVEGLVKRHAKEIAAIIVEPVAGNMGVVLPEKGFLEALRSLSRERRILLIFDEVITGFRLAFGGAQKLFKLKPDLTCLGKIIGGGLPVGAFGGRWEIMKLLSPEGNVYQAGTFSGNPLTVNAGLAALKALSKGNPYQKLEENTRRLCRKCEELAQKYGVSLKINSIGSLFSIFFTDKDVADYASAGKQSTTLFGRFYRALLSEGIYLAPSGFESNFVSTAHVDTDIEKTKVSIEKVLKNL